VGKSPLNFTQKAMVCCVASTLKPALQEKNAASKTQQDMSLNYQIGEETVE